MACFTVPLAEGIILSAVKKKAFRKNADSVIKAKLGHLETMLFGGNFLLAKSTFRFRKVIQQSFIKMTTKKK